MEKQVKTMTLSNSWEDDNMSKLQNTTDIQCIGVSGQSNILLDDTLMVVVGTGQLYEREPYHVGYGGLYKLTSTGGQVQCTIQKYSDSTVLNFVTGGELTLVFILGLYILLFTLGLRHSFFR